MVAAWKDLCEYLKFLEDKKDPVRIEKQTDWNKEISRDLRIIANNANPTLWSFDCVADKRFARNSPNVKQLIHAKVYK